MGRHCPYCPTVLKGLQALLQDRLIGKLETVVIEDTGLRELELVGCGDLPELVHDGDTCHLRTVCTKTCGLDVEERDVEPDVVTFRDGRHSDVSFRLRGLVQRYLFLQFSQSVLRHVSGDGKPCGL